MENKRTELEKLGEFGLIDHLTEKFNLNNKSLRKFLLSASSSKFLFVAPASVTYGAVC